MRRPRYCMEYTHIRHHRSPPVTMVLHLPCVCLALAFQPLHPNVSVQHYNRTSVVSIYYHFNFGGHPVSRYGNTNSRSIERERLSFVTFPGAATCGSN
ncbi:uncharacterized protein BO88DRAFT_466209 [Aspergillus vadensis CBS 113365]|uniref:Secreted protein n=1 Tax=Aspergillus vadensis (strain CBS 113365 / IMI 142717 / IBT 24658) TaxID=1448311 RepID=A0A319B2U1_ASPVC|nr:hypothetical protein BO88DRAFT_466209 [Aspergillus vadensis CBS 113365]PYH67037.1 hypothetical protein BO88DRAFT_466209 [Aspergillus vadensis CBS 113365]